MRRIAILAGIAGLMAPAAATAQAGTNRVDTLFSIVAVVGDSIISHSELQRMLDLWSSTYRQPLPPPGPKLDTLTEQILDSRIEMLLVLQAATQDTSIHVSDEEVRNAVDAQVSSAQAQFPSRAQFEAALAAEHLTLQEYRELLATRVREQRLSQLYEGKLRQDRKPPHVSNEEIREEFDRRVELGGGLPTLPPSITFEQVAVPVSPSDTALARAKAKADSVLALIQSGGQDFDAVARRLSEDPGSAELGGDLGWFRPGSMTIDFERAVYSPLLKPGSITGPVLTPYGYHIIRLERVRGPERNARHILIRAGIYDDDIQRARALADSVAKRIRAGASMDSLRRVLGDPDEPARLGPLVRDSMPAEFRTALENASDGDIVGPFSFENPLQKWVIVRVEQVEPERQATVEDYREQIRRELSQEKFMDEVIAELKRQTFIEIRGPGASQRK